MVLYHLNPWLGSGGISIFHICCNQIWYLLIIKISAGARIGRVRVEVERSPVPSIPSWTRARGRGREAPARGRMRASSGSCGESSVLSRESRLLQATTSTVLVSRVALTTTKKIFRKRKSLWCISHLILNNPGYRFVLLSFLFPTSKKLKFRYWVLSQTPLLGIEIVQFSIRGE